MAEIYRTFGNRPGQAVGQGRELSRTSNTRRFLLWERLESKFKITLVHQRKPSGGDWLNEPSKPFSTLKAGEAKKFILSYEETEKLREELNRMHALVDQTHLRRGADHLVVAPEAEVVITGQNRARTIRELLNKGYSDDLWDALIQNDPDLVTRLSYARIHSENQKALGEFEANLKLRQGEQWWEDFFKRNTWIFGYGLNYKFLSTLQAQPSYGGTGVNGAGMQKGDFLQRTEAFLRFTVLVEIKKPGTDLLGNKKYRNGAWELHEELTGGVSQLHANCRTWEKEGSETEANLEAFLRQRTFTVQPKAILVIGHTNQLTDASQRNTFELFRRNLVNPEILTFDELYERAKFIVESTKDADENATAFASDEDAFLADGDVPF